MTVSSSGAQATTVPRIRDQRAAVAETTRERLADLGRGRDVVLVLDGTGAEQQLPVVLAGVEREVRRNRDQVRPWSARIRTAREADVVADGQPGGPALHVEDDGLVARSSASDSR